MRWDQATKVKRKKVMAKSFYQSTVCYHQDNNAMKINITTRVLNMLLKNSSQLAYGNTSLHCMMVGMV